MNTIEKNVQSSTFAFLHNGLKKKVQFDWSQLRQRALNLFQLAKQHIQGMGKKIVHLQSEI